MTIIHNGICNIRPIQLAMIVFFALFSLPAFMNADSSPACYKRIQTTFFREDLLATGLNMYQVQQSVWYTINSDLQTVSAQVPGIVQQMANATTPNPLSPHFEPNKAMEILQKALYGVFKNVMLRYRASSNYSPIDINTINGVFNYMWQQQIQQIEACIFAQNQR
jgi:hypothetical protein